MIFRVGGREKKTFGPKGDPKLTSEGSYLDIVPDSRIVSAFSMRETRHAYFRNTLHGGVVGRRQWYATDSYRSVGVFRWPGNSDDAQVGLGAGIGPAESALGWRKCDKGLGC
jgi:uncharacterized protein YndB with AHSA1/START domain